MKRIWIIISGVIMCLMSGLILHSYVVESKEVNRDLSSEHIGGVFLGSSLDDLDPSSIKKAQGDQMFLYYDVTLTVNEMNQIVYVSSEEAGIKTYEGIAVGHDKTDLISHYGIEFEEHFGSGGSFIRYYDKQSDIRFWLDETETIYFIELQKR